MATGKRYYWMKLQQSFMTSDIIDFFMSQQNGAQYVVLYQMLCLRTINTGGKLEARIGEVLIPFDAAKITRDMRWFTEDTVRVAMQLYQRFGLIYTDEDGVLVMADHNSLVGSETDYAEKKKLQRSGKGNRPKKLSCGDADSTGDNEGDNVPTEIRDREKEQEEKVAEDDMNGLREIVEDHNEILNAAEGAGFPKNRGTWDRIIDLYAEYGKEVTLAGIGACVEHGKTTVAYLRACCRGIAGGEPPEGDPLMPKDHVMFEW